jgi:hypothetical protein
VRLLPIVVLLALGCGMRHVARPPTYSGYTSVAVRDVSAVGMKDVNVEVVGVLGPMVPQEVCHGLVTFPLMDVAPGGGGLSILMSHVTISLPRTRYNEVRDLHSNDQVRVRGYLSKYFAEGCDWVMLDASRYLWVDTIEKVSLP